MKPLFLETPAGRIFGVYHAPASDMPDHGDIIFLPPFAEELNRARHMINRQAASLSAGGYGVFIPDLYGTGDSEGRFDESGWTEWVQSIEAAQSWLQGQGRSRISFWAMRTGALLLEDIQLQAGTPFILLWNPVSNGDTFLNQFLRIRVSGEMSGQHKETTKELRARLTDGEIIEVGGYGLNGQLAHDISGKRLKNFAVPPASRIIWLEVAATSPASLSPAGEKHISHWQDSGANVLGTSVTGPMFWVLQEPEWADELLTTTTRLVQDVKQ